MIKKNIFLIVIILFVTSKLLADIKIVVSIDDEIITNHDIEKERNYLEVLNPNLIQLDINQKSNLAKNSLINEFVKKKETNKFRGADSNNQLIDDYLKNLYFKLGLSSEKEFENILKQNNNFNLSEIKEKITIELLWNELIYSKYNYQVKIDKNKILSKVNALQEDLKKEYFLSEIVFAKKKKCNDQ
jgi:peptidyl-prolyl cis-trans isomerase SurA